MCVILSIYQKNKIAIDSIIEKIEDLKLKNPDGVGIVSFNKETQNWQQNRKLEIKKTDISQILKKNDIINIHLRHTTAGETNNANIHFWKHNNWHFAHNGHIQDLGENKKYSDSYLLFRQFIEKNYITENDTIKHIKIKKLINKLSFWGRFVLINTKTQKTYFFGDFHALSINEKTLIISTENISLNQYQNIFGVLFKKENKNTFLRKKLDGIFYIDNQKEKLTQLEKELKEIYTSDYTYDNYFNTAIYNRKKKKKKKKKNHFEWTTI